MDDAAIRANLIRRSCIGSIPDDWGIVTVAELVERKPNAIVGGPFGSDLVSTDYVPSGIPVIRGANMSAASVSGDFVFIAEAKGKSLASNMAAPGDVVFTQRGTLGQVAIVPEGTFEKYLISQSQMKLSANGDVVHKPYLLHYFASFAGQKQILDSAIQTGVPHTNLTILRNYAVPMPAYPEQEAIAEALSDADALIEGLERLIAKKRLIKQGAMQDLLTAKRRLPGFSGEWDSFLIGDFLNFKNGLNKAKSFFGHGTPIVNYMDVFGGGRIDAASIAGLVEVTTAEQSAYGVKDGDILFTRTSETPDEIGLAAVADGVPEGTVFSGFVLRGRPQNEKLTRNFSKYCFRSEPIRRQIISRATYTTRALTNGRQLSQVEIFAPNDAAEQDAIASVLTDMDTEIQALDTRLEKARQMKEGMMQTLLTGRIRLV